MTWFDLFEPLAPHPLAFYIDVRTGARAHKHLHEEENHIPSEASHESTINPIKKTLGK